MAKGGKQSAPLIFCTETAQNHFRFQQTNESTVAFDEEKGDMERILKGVECA